MYGEDSGGEISVDRSLGNEECVRWPEKIMRGR